MDEDGTDDTDDGTFVVVVVAAVVVADDDDDDDFGGSYFSGVVTGVFLPPNSAENIMALFSIECYLIVFVCCLRAENDVKGGILDWKKKNHGEEPTEMLSSTPGNKSSKKIPLNRLLFG